MLRLQALPDIRFRHMRQGVRLPQAPNRIKLPLQFLALGAGLHHHR